MVWRRPELELKEIFDVQRNFDRKMGWNRYEKCETPEDILNFMQHLVMVMVEELGEVSSLGNSF